MRLLFTPSEFPPGPGGIGTHAYELAQHLVKLGWEIVVITPQNYASQEEIKAFDVAQPFTIRRLPHLPVAALKAVYRWHVISGWVKKWKPEIYLASGDRTVYLGACIAQRHRLPWIAVEHGRIPAGWERRLKRWALQQASTVVCVSEYTRQQMNAIGIRPRMERVIPNGANAARFRALPSQEVNDFRAGLRMSRAKLLLSVGNVSERKGQDVVIRALPLILEKEPNTQYLIAGMPTREKDFRRLARRLGVADHVHFLGRVDTDSLILLLNCCDIFVMTSRHTVDEFEGFGIAVVEAALCGKPAVVTANSGLAEAIVDGETGLCVPEDDEFSTAQAILSLLKDEEQRQRIGEAARVRALVEQRWESRVGEYDALLRGLLRPTAVTSVRENSEAEHAF